MERPLRTNDDDVSNVTDLKISEDDPDKSDDVDQATDDQEKCGETDEVHDVIAANASFQDGDDKEVEKYLKALIAVENESWSWYGSESRSYTNFSRDGSDSSSPRLSAGRQKKTRTVAGEDKQARNLEADLLLLVEQGSLRATSYLAKQNFRQKRYLKALTLLRRCPEWDLEAQYRLGVIYFDGLDVKTNYKAALKCMMRVATAEPKTAGIPEEIIRSAQYLIGTAYYGGFGVADSEETALRWWRLAAQDGKPNGNVNAQLALGLYYSDSWHKDVKQAAFWHRCADANGGTQSTAPYGVMCQHGIGTEANQPMALKKLKTAAFKYGSTYAAGNLVAYYFQRKLHNMAAHIAFNLLKRERNLDRVCNQHDRKGLAMAYFYLGRCHQLGLAVNKDEQLASHLFRHAVGLDITVVHPLYIDWIYGII